MNNAPKKVWICNPCAQKRGIELSISAPYHMETRCDICNGRFATQITKEEFDDSQSGRTDGADPKPLS